MTASGGADAPETGSTGRPQPAADTRALRLQVRCVCQSVPW